MYLLVILIGIIAAEVFGYFLHRLLHSEKIKWLSRNHMIHHLKLYGPKMSMRTDKYLYVPSESSIFGIGFEWIIPSSLIIGSFALVFYLLSIPLVYQVVFFVSVLGWVAFLFSYMHDIMHVKNHWITRSRFRKWFGRARRLHDIHHVKIEDSGKINCNFGICFFSLDKMFGTYKTSVGKFNEEGFKESQEKYGWINE